MILSWVCPGQVNAVGVGNPVFRQTDLLESFQPTLQVHNENRVLTLSFHFISLSIFAVNPRLVLNLHAFTLLKISLFHYYSRNKSFNGFMLSRPHFPLFSLICFHWRIQCL